MGKLPLNRLKYRLTLKALSPIHIGTGLTEPACRYAVQDQAGGKAFFLKDSLILPQLPVRSPEEFMKKPFSGRYGPKDVLYTLTTTKSGRTLNKEARPFMRDGWGRAYVPGSSLKGVIRQALLFSYLKDKPEQLDQMRKELEKTLEDIRRMSPRNRNKPKTPKEVAWKIENLFRSSSGRPDPKNDIGRAIQLSDSAPIESPLILGGVGIFTAAGKSLKAQSEKTPSLFVEALEPGTTVTFDLTIDTALLEHLGNPEGIRFRNAVDLLGALQDRWEFVRELEKAFLRQSGAYEELWDQAFDSAGEDEAIIRLGAGSGLMGASLFPLLAYSEKVDRPNKPSSRKAITKGDASKALFLFGFASLRFEKNEG